MARSNLTSPAPSTISGPSPNRSARASMILRFWVTAALAAKATIPHISSIALRMVRTIGRMIRLLRSQATSPGFRSISSRSRRLSRFIAVADRMVRTTLLQPLTSAISNSFLGSLALKNTQGFFGDASKPRVVQQYGCVVMEVEDWIDAINQPEWQRSKRNIFGPDTGPYSLEATYRFSVKGR